MIENSARRRLLDVLVKILALNFDNIPTNIELILSHETGIRFTSLFSEC